jgi:periplasmic copper chaperone A
MPNQEKHEESTDHRLHHRPARGPATAAAHVTLQPNETAAGGFTRLDVRVPNERDNASTTKVEVKFPPGFTTVSTEPVPGWTARVTRSKLAKPQVNDEGEKVTDQVDTITWTGDGNQGAIRPGEFRDFGLSLATPDKPGTSLTFKALQTYSNGEVVRWIGPPDAEEPAPQVKLTAADQSQGGAGSSLPAGTKASNASSTSDDDTGAPTWLAVLALVIGVLGLVAGGTALMKSRRRARV